MAPRKANPQPENPILSMRIPPETMRQLDELCKKYGMNRNQLLLVLIAKEYGKIEEAKP